MNFAHLIIFTFFFFFYLSPYSFGKKPISVLHDGSSKAHIYSSDSSYAFKLFNEQQKNQAEREWKIYRENYDQTPYLLVTTTAHIFCSVCSICIIFFQKLYGYWVSFFVINYWSLLLFFFFWQGWVCRASYCIIIVFVFFVDGKCFCWLKEWPPLFSPILGFFQNQVFYSFKKLFEI